MAAGAAGLAGAGLIANGLTTKSSKGIAPASAATREAVEVLAWLEIVTENKKPGSTDWQLGKQGTRAADDMALQIKGFASATSVAVGESIDFHVSVGTPEKYTIGFYRLGHYGGLGARHIQTTAALAGTTQPKPDIDHTTGVITCPWAVSYRLEPAADWVSGLYLAVLTTQSGWRNYVPFVVRPAGRANGLAVVMPFTTYQAYNQWPLDGAVGKSLYYGYPDDPSLGRQPDGTWKSAPINADLRARKVSFDRPYLSEGLPKRFDEDQYFIQWAEEAGLPLSYYTSIDLEDGRLDPSAYTGVIFAAHDEYWSRGMRERVTVALHAGTSLAFMAANNMYWNIRFEPSTDGRPNRIVTCYKASDDPVPDRSKATMRWRDSNPGPKQPEQAVLGVQFNGIVKSPTPLVVRAADHWFWAGTGVTNGQQIPKIVAGEADGLDPAYPRPTGVYRHTLLSSSPYVQRIGGPAPQPQNTSVYETNNGAIVFVAGSLNWTKGLWAPGIRDEKIRIATRNLFRRILERHTSVGVARSLVRRVFFRNGRTAARTTK
jgi:hypothetical protein